MAPALRHKPTLPLNPRTNHTRSRQRRILELIRPLLRDRPGEHGDTVTALVLHLVRHVELVPQAAQDQLGHRLGAVLAFGVVLLDYDMVLLFL